MDIRRLLARNLKRLRLERLGRRRSWPTRPGCIAPMFRASSGGVRNPTITIVAALAKALGVAASELLAGR